MTSPPSRARFLVATSNPGKLRDFAFAASDIVQIAPLPELDAIAPPPEDEATFEGNATMKAAFYSLFAPGELVIADDSGLEVDALSGAPGVRSARYADDMDFAAEAGVDERNNRCLVAALHGVAAEGRAARYRCVLAAAIDGRIVACGTGSVEGSILRAAQGTGGFGYDPFFLPRGESRSMAELDPAIRMTLSHRGRALRDLIVKLQSIAGRLCL